MAATSPPPVVAGLGAWTTRGSVATLRILQGDTPPPRMFRLPIDRRARFRDARNLLQPTRAHSCRGRAPSLSETGARARARAWASGAAPTRACRVRTRATPIPVDRASRYPQYMLSSPFVCTVVLTPSCLLRRSLLGAPARRGGERSLSCAAPPATPPPRRPNRACLKDPRGCERQCRDRHV